MTHSKFIFVLILSGILIFSENSRTYSEDLDETLWERFSEFDETSKTRINHDPLTELMDGIVLTVGRSKARLGRAKTKTFRESRITFGSTSPSRYESNRIIYHALSDDHKLFIKDYIAGMERLSERRPMASYNKNEQLAFWLNLHNLLVIDMLAEEYPVKNLKGLRFGSSRQKNAWNQNRVTIEDVSLSIRDIELIVANNWDDPLVIYGLYQGSVGGPSLPNVAFDSDNVWILLEKAAIEFINSNRGVRPKRSKMEVSDFYEWQSAAFGGSSDTLLQHIQNYAEESFLGDITNIMEVEFDYYDWMIADLLGGVLHTGRPNQLGGLLSSATIRQQDFNYFQNLTPTGSGRQIYPPQALEFMYQVLINNDVPTRVPLITTEECLGEGCFENNSTNQPEQ